MALRTFYFVNVHKSCIRRSQRHLLAASENKRWFRLLDYIYGFVHLSAAAKPNVGQNSSAHVVLSRAAIWTLISFKWSQLKLLYFYWKAMKLIFHEKYVMDFKGTFWIIDALSELFYIPNPFNAHSLFAFVNLQIASLLRIQNTS